MLGVVLLGTEVVVTTDFYLAILGAEGLRKMAMSLQSEGGGEAMRLRIAEQYIEQPGHLAKEGNTFVLPAS